MSASAMQHQENLDHGDQQQQQDEEVMEVRVQREMGIDRLHKRKVSTLHKLV
jgi:hypothetical protein